MARPQGPSVIARIQTPLGPGDARLLQEAKAFIEQENPGLAIVEIRKAFTQRVPFGVAVRIICKVKEDQGYRIWKAGVWRGATGGWQVAFQKRKGKAEPRGGERI